MAATMMTSLVVAPVLLLFALLQMAVPVGAHRVAVTAPEKGGAEGDVAVAGVEEAPTASIPSAGRGRRGRGGGRRYLGFFDQSGRGGGRGGGRGRGRGRGRGGRGGRGRGARGGRGRRGAASADEDVTFHRGTGFFDEMNTHAGPIRVYSRPRGTTVSRPGYRSSVAIRTHFEMVCHTPSVKIECDLGRVCNAVYCRETVRGVANAKITPFHTEQLLRKAMYMWVSPSNRCTVTETLGEGPDCSEELFPFTEPPAPEPEEAAKEGEAAKKIAAAPEAVAAA